MKRFQFVGSALLPMLLAATFACSSGDGALGTGGLGTGAQGSGAESGSGASAAGGALGTGGAGSGSTGSGGESFSCDDFSADTCDFGAGVVHVCKRRFALGVNYAWKNFGADFGGLSAWAQAGISENAAVATELANMADSGVSVVRWWMFPDFRGDGVTFDANGDPSGLSAGAIADIQKALELADQNDLYLTLTIFSFDNFRPDKTEGGITIRGMAPMVADAARRKKLIDNVVRPVAKAVHESPYSRRLFAWDIINEPEWAVASAGLAQNDFDPNDELTAVTLEQMKALISEAATALGEAAPGTKRSVGWAAAKWAPPFADLTGIDFHQPHIYSWVNEWWPYTRTPSELGYGDKPTIMGEFYLQATPLSPSSSDTYATIVGSWFDVGYAGAWAWQYNENVADIGLIKAFGTEKGCVATY